MKVATIFSAVRHVPITYLRFARQSCPTHFLCAYLCVTEFPSVDYTREIWIFEPASSPSEAANFRFVLHDVSERHIAPKLVNLNDLRRSERWGRSGRLRLAATCSA